MLPLSQEDKELINQLNRHPDIKDRMKSIISIANNDGDGIVTADEAESRGGSPVGGENSPQR